MEELFSKVLQVTVFYRDCEQRKANIRVTIELRMTTNPAYKQDLLLKLTDDLDPFFLFTLPISDEDFQSLKVQQGLLVDFASFPQKFIDLLNLCCSQQTSENPRFLLQLSCQSAALDGPCNLSVVETNAFKHLNHLSLRLIQGSDKDVKEYLAACFSALKSEKVNLESKLQKTEEDLSRQLSDLRQLLSQRNLEVDKLRSDWTSQSSSLSSRHSQELQLEREKTAELQKRLQQQSEQVLQDLDSAHKRSSQQLQCRVSQLEVSCQELSEVKFRNESLIRELKVKLVGAEEEFQHAKQQVASLRRENGTLDTELHDKERLVSQLQLRVAQLEQGISDKDQLLGRTKEGLEATQQQKALLEENADSKERHLKSLEATIKSLSQDQQKANDIIRKLQGDLRELLGKNKVKNGVIVSQEKVVEETTAKLQRVQKDLQSTQETLAGKEEQVVKLKEQLESTVQKLNECKDVLKTNENVISWLNKQLNEQQLPRKPLETLENPTPGVRAHFSPQTGGLSLPLGLLTDVSPTERQAGQTARSHKAGLDSKYFGRRPDSIPVYNPSSNPPSRDFSQRPKAAIDSAYFSA